MTPQLRTKRLVLKPLELADAKQAKQLFPQREIVGYRFDGGRRCLVRAPVRTVMHDVARIGLLRQRTVAGDTVSVTIEPTIAAPKQPIERR
jgi:hypothetical protein